MLATQISKEIWQNGEEQDKGGEEWEGGRNSSGRKLRYWWKLMEMYIDNIIYYVYVYYVYYYVYFIMFIMA